MKDRPLPEVPGAENYANASAISKLILLFLLTDVKQNSHTILYH